MQGNQVSSLGSNWLYCLNVYVDSLLAYALFLEFVFVKVSGNVGEEIFKIGKMFDDRVPPLHNGGKFHQKFYRAVGCIY